MWFWPLFHFCASSLATITRVKLLNVRESLPLLLEQHASTLVRTSSQTGSFRPALTAQIRLISSLVLAGSKLQRVGQNRHQPGGLGWDVASTYKSGNAFGYIVYILFPKQHKHHMYPKFTWRYFAISWRYLFWVFLKFTFTYFRLVPVVRKLHVKILFSQFAVLKYFLSWQLILV